MLCWSLLLLENSHWKENVPVAPVLEAPCAAQRCRLPRAPEALGHLLSQVSVWQALPGLPRPLPVLPRPLAVSEAPLLQQRVRQV